MGAQLDLQEGMELAMGEGSSSQEQSQEQAGSGEKAQSKSGGSKTADEIEEKKKGVCNGLVLFENIRTLNTETH